VLLCAACGGGEFSRSDAEIEGEFTATVEVDGGASVTPMPPTTAPMPSGVTPTPTSAPTATTKPPDPPEVDAAPPVPECDDGTKRCAIDGSRDVENMIEVCDRGEWVPHTRCPFTGGNPEWLCEGGRCTQCINSVEGTIARPPHPNAPSQCMDGLWTSCVGGSGGTPIEILCTVVSPIRYVDGQWTLVHETALPAVY
jgi:hypothetical protein